MSHNAAVLAPQVALVIDDHRVDEGVPGAHLPFEKPESIVGPLAKGAETIHGVLRWNKIFKDSSSTLRWTQDISDSRGNLLFDDEGGQMAPILNSLCLVWNPPRKGCLSRAVSSLRGKWRAGAATFGTFRSHFNPYGDWKAFEG